MRNNSKKGISLIICASMIFAGCSNNTVAETEETTIATTTTIETATTTQATTTTAVTTTTTVTTTEAVEEKKSIGINDLYGLTLDETQTALEKMLGYNLVSNGEADLSSKEIYQFFKPSNNFILSLFGQQFAVCRVDGENTREKPNYINSIAFHSSEPAYTEDWELYYTEDTVWLEKGDAENLYKALKDIYGEPSASFEDKDSSKFFWDDTGDGAVVFKWYTDDEFNDTDIECVYLEFYENSEHEGYLEYRGEAE